MKNIFLIGFMGCGKSTVAAGLSAKYGMDIVEMDQIIVEREGMSISDIFAQKGELYFRDVETQLLIEIQSENNKVVSCGGGVAMRKQNVEAMRKGGCVVLLTANPETILERVKDDNSRPLLQGNKNIDFINEMLEKRRAKYESAADIVIQTDEKRIDDICEEIITQIS